MIQQAIAQVLTPLYDGEFSPHSYGFRARRNAHQAVRHVEADWKAKRRYAVDCDLKAFFDTVNHDRLLTQMRAKIGGGRLLQLIGRYLRAGVELPDGRREATPPGVPKGARLPRALCLQQQLLEGTGSARTERHLDPAALRYGDSPQPNGKGKSVAWRV